MNLYNEKNTSYFTNVRFDLINLLPANPESRVLELGAGGGDTLVDIKKKGLAKEVIGIELMEIPNSNQSNELIDKFLIADIEKSELSFPHSYFDAILIGDVLEHLEDPWKVVARLSEHVKEGGIFIVSIPNIRFWGGLYKIYIKGDFGYEKQGLFDRTHLRFFCKKNMVQLFSMPFLKVKNVVPIQKLRGRKKLSMNNIVNTCTFGLFEQFLTIQYIIVAEKI